MADSQASIVLPPLGTVLVTGGCGFLGSHIVSLLHTKASSSNTAIHVLDVRPPVEQQEGTRYHTGDITDRSFVKNLIDSVKPDVIIHTASPIILSGGSKANELMRRVNVEGTRNLLEESKRIGTKAFVYTSSASVISDQSSDLVNVDESWPVLMGSEQPEFYASTKAEAEQLVLQASTRTRTPFLTTSLRPSAIFGEGDVQQIPNMLQVLKDGMTKYQLGSNDNLWDFTYVGNVAHAHLLAAGKLVQLHQELLSNPTINEDYKQGEADLENKVDGEAFIITNQQPIYFWDFTRTIWNGYYNLRPTTFKPPTSHLKTFQLSRDIALLIATILTFLLGLFGKSPRLQPSRVRFACMTRYFKSKKSEKGLGYMPIYRLDEGIERTVRWFAQRDEEKERDEGSKKGR